MEEEHKQVKVRVWGVSFTLFFTLSRPLLPCSFAFSPIPPKDTLFPTFSYLGIEKVWGVSFTPLRTHSSPPHLCMPVPHPTLIPTVHPAPSYLAIENVWGVSFTPLCTHSSPPPLSMQRADARRLDQPTN